MIKDITAGSGIQINGGHISWPSFYNNSASNNNTLVGQVRYNGSSQNMEVYDGMTWLSMPATYTSIELAPHVQAVVHWAQIKMAEEARLKTLMDAHPGIQDLKQKLDVMVALVTADQDQPKG